MTTLLEEISQKLSSYGFSVQNSTKKQTQKQILLLYEDIEKKLRQNFSLKKENEDMALQLKTIEEILPIKSSPTQSPLVGSPFFKSNPKVKVQPLRIQKEAEPFRISQESSNINDLTQISPSKAGQNSRWTLNGCQNRTQRKEKVIYSQSDNCLSSKIELLIKQNGQILERLAWIQSNLDLNSEIPSRNGKRKRQEIDDRKSHVSTQATSIYKLESLKTASSEKFIHKQQNPQYNSLVTYQTQKTSFRVSK